MEMTRWLNWDLACTMASFSESITCFFLGRCFKMPRLGDDERLLHNNEQFREKKIKKADT